MPPAGQRDAMPDRAKSMAAGEPVQVQGVTAGAPSPSTSHALSTGRNTIPVNFEEPVNFGPRRGASDGTRKQRALEGDSESRSFMVALRCSFEVVIRT